MENRTEFDALVEQMSKPKYGGIDAFFGALTLMIIVLAVPVSVVVWRWAF